MNINEKKPLSPFIKALSNERLVQFSRLTADAIPQISTFLNSIWSQHYGKTGSPVFHPDYLRWVLGGPNKDKNILYGAIINNEMVAYQSLIYRKISCSNVELNSYLHTHLAISPKIDLRSRMDCGLQMGEQSILFHRDSSYYDPSCDLVFGYVEEGKPLKNVGDSLLSKYFNIERKTCSSFNQFALIPQRLKKYMAENVSGRKLLNVRSATEEDVAPLTALFNQRPEETHFIMLMTQEELRHYFFGHSSRRTFVVEGQNGLDALITCYPLEMIKENKRSLYLIIEFILTDRLIGDSQTALAALLAEAVKHAEEIGVKGIVFENATYLNYRTFQPLGLIPTFRKMSMVLASKENNVKYTGGFRCDIK